MSRRRLWIAGVGIVLVLTLVGGLAWRTRDARPLELRPEGALSGSPGISPAGSMPPRATPAVESRAPVGSAPAAGTPPPSSAAPLSGLSPRSATRAGDGTPRDKARYPATPVLPPDDAVGEIRRLLGRGERAEALRQLRDLRRQHPRYDLPQDLLDIHP